VSSRTSFWPNLDRERTGFGQGVDAGLLRAAKMYAFMKGMGFSGVHIGGHGVKYEQLLFVIEKGEELGENWQDLVAASSITPQPGGFYLYERDSTTGLNRETPVRLENRPLDAPVGFVYRLSRIFHQLMFEPGRNLFGFMRSFPGRGRHRRGRNLS